MSRRFYCHVLPFLLLVGLATLSLAASPKLEVGYFGKAEGVNRVGKPLEVTCLVRNLDAAAAEEVTLTLGVPEGVKLLGPAAQKIDRVTKHLGRSANWSIESSAPGTITVSVKVEAAGIAPITGATAIELTPTPDAPKGNGVPEPRPVPCKYDLGTFYFPGWVNMAKWSPIVDYPDRKPILGWYDEANPECVDWQIKWAVEHGIRFFMVDWYWNQGNRYLDHWVHQGFMNAKHRRYLKWCVMWANHNGPGSHSADDWRKVTQYWIDNYFGMEEYYRIDDKPVVVIWAPTNITNDVGGTEQTAKLFAESQEMAKKAGYKGVYFVSMGYYKTAALCAQQKTEGYEAATSYHTFPYVQKKIKTPGRFPFSEVVRYASEIWQSENEKSGGLNYWPVVETGWADEPWAGAAKATMIEERTPEQFGKLCRLAREFADKHNKKTIVIGPWNEWGEGSYIEPCAEFGFAQLDALRAAFCEPGEYPPNLIPSDVGLGPYDFPFSRNTAWNFDAEGNMQGWSPNSHIKGEARGGVLHGQSIGADPVLHGPAVRFEAQNTSQLVVRIKCNAAEQAQLFWSTLELPQSERTSVRFAVPGDGQFHDCKVDLGKHPEWRGLIRSIRLDPVSHAGVEFEIDSITLQ